MLIVMNTIAFFSLNNNVESTMVEYTLADIISQSGYSSSDLDTDTTYAIIRKFCAQHNVYWWQQQYNSVPMRRLICGQAEDAGKDGVFIETFGLIK